MSSSPKCVCVFVRGALSRTPTGAVACEPSRVQGRPLRWWRVVQTPFPAKCLKMVDESDHCPSVSLYYFLSPFKGTVDCFSECVSMSLSRLLSTSRSSTLSGGQRFSDSAQPWIRPRAAQLSPNQEVCHIETLVLLVVVS